MDILDKSIHLMRLYDLYQELLTDKQKTYFESYYFDDFSISEISENMNVSRNAVHDQLKRTIKKMHDFEEKLAIFEKTKQRQIIIGKVKDISNNQDVINLMNELEKVE